MKLALLYAKSSHDQMAKCWQSFSVLVCAFFLCNTGRKEGFGLWFWCLLPRWYPGLVSWIVIHGVHVAAVQQIFQFCSVIWRCESFSMHHFILEFQFMWRCPWTGHSCVHLLPWSFFFPLWMFTVHFCSGLPVLYYLKCQKCLEFPVRWRDIFLQQEGSIICPIWVAPQ